MKNLLLLLLVMASVQAATAQTAEWDEWQKTSCYSKIWFRLKEMPKNGEQHHWQIQFRTDYTENISFNYHVTDKLQQYNITTHRKSLGARQTSDVVEVYTKEADIFLLVDKVSMTPYPEDFVPCDK